jgi:hypothetical protein
MATPIIAGVAALTTVAGSAISSRASGQAASTQANAAREAGALQAEATREQIAAQERMFERQIELQEPFRQSGINALGQLTSPETRLPAAFSGQVNMLADPGYQFRLSEGLKALDRQAAARGGLISGGALKAAQRYGQDYASGEYGAAYNRALTEYNAQVGRADTSYNRLAGQAGIGQTATGQLSNAAGQAGSNVSNIIGQGAQLQGQALGAAGQARASGYVGQANAFNQGISGLTNMYFQNEFLNRAYPQNNLNSSIYANSPYNNLQDPGGMAQTNIGFSDRRLKTNIHRISTRPDGLGVYKFEYIWGGGDQIGLMAQEVQNVYPEAIGEIDGFLTVDYSKV